MQDKLDAIKQRFHEVNDLIIQPEVIADQRRYIQLTREYKDLKKLVDAREKYMELQERLAEARSMIRESDGKGRD